MRSSWRPRLVAIVLAVPMVWLLADRTLSAGKPEGSLPAGTVRLSGGFGSAPEGAETTSLQPTIHVVPRVTDKMVKTWEILQRPIDLHDFAHETPLEDFVKYLRSETQDKDGKGGLCIYVDPNCRPQVSAQNIADPIQIDLDGVKIATGLKLVLMQIGLIFHVQEDGVVVITGPESGPSPADPNEKLLEDLDDLRREVAELRHALNRQPAPAPLDKKPEPAPPAVKKTQLTRVVQFGGMGGALNSAPDGAAPVTKPAAVVSLVHPLSAQAAATWRRLHSEVDVPFPNETALEDFLRYLKEKSMRGKDDKELSFYVDPVGLQEVEKSITDPVQLELEGVPIATALDLALKQLGLTFSVHDEGFVFITNRESDSAEFPGSSAPLLDTINAIRLEVRAMRIEASARAGFPAP